MGDEGGVGGEGETAGDEGGEGEDGEDGEAGEDGVRGTCSIIFSVSCWPGVFSPLPMSGSSVRCFAGVCMAGRRLRRDVHQIAAGMASSMSLRQSSRPNASCVCPGCRR